MQDRIISEALFYFKFNYDVLFNVTNEFIIISKLSNVVINPSRSISLINFFIILKISIPNSTYLWSSRFRITDIESDPYKSYRISFINFLYLL